MKNCICNDCGLYYPDSFGYFGVCTGLVPGDIKHDCQGFEQVKEEIEK